MKPIMKELVGFTLSHSTAVFFVLILLWFGVQAPQFLQPESLANIIKQSSFIGIAALGMTVVLITGGIDLSVGSVMFLAPLIAGMAMRSFGLPVEAGFVVAMVVGAGLGGLNAFFIVVLRVVPFIVTLASLFVFRGFGTWLTSSTQFDFPERMRTFGLSDLLGIPTPILVFVVTAVIIHIVLRHTGAGRQIYAFGNDREAARKAGLAVGRIEARAYMISAVCAAISGFVMISQIGRLDVGFGQGREFDVIAAAVLGGASLFGGVGTALGAVAGATLIQTAKLGLVFTGVNLYMQPIILGTVIFAAMVADGIRGRRLRDKLARTIRPLRSS